MGRAAPRKYILCKKKFSPRVGNLSKKIRPPLFAKKLENRFQLCVFFWKIFNLRRKIFLAKYRLSRRRGRIFLKNIFTLGRKNFLAAHFFSRCSSAPRSAEGSLQFSKRRLDAQSHPAAPRKYIYCKKNFPSPVENLAKKIPPTVVCEISFEVLLRNFSMPGEKFCCQIFFFATQRANFFWKILNLWREIFLAQYLFSRRSSAPRSAKMSVRFPKADETRNAIRQRKWKGGVAKLAF